MIVDPNVIAGNNIVKMTPYSKIQQSGIDITVKKIRRIISCTSFDVTYDDINLPNILQPGAYDVEFNEYVNVPTNMVAIIITRSTFNRRGSFITTGLYDNGFKNYIGAVLHVTVPISIAKDERIAQIVFMNCNHEAQYQGQYNDKKM